MAVAELMGEVCCDRELYSVYCDGDTMNCCTGIAKSVAMMLEGWWRSGGGTIRRWEEGRPIRLKYSHQGW